VVRTRRRAAANYPREPTHRIEGALRKALVASPAEPVALTGLAQLAVARHQFRAAVSTAREALTLGPRNGAARGALGDALLASGRYRRASRAYDRLAAAGPSVAAYARVAVARQLLVRRDAALDALELALEAGSTIPEQQAWTFAQYGNLLAPLGRLDRAASAYREALALVPAYVHAHAGLARVAAARGRLTEAARLLRSVVARVPAPQYAIQLEDVLARAGRRAETRAYALVAAIERLLRANGVRTELQTALFDLDRGVRLRDALARDRALSRCLGCGEVVPPGSGHRSHVLVPLGARGAEVRSVRRVLTRAAALGVLLAVLVPARAAAHPLGNFTVNRYAGLELAGSRLYVHYVLDVAEISTFQLGSQIKAAGYPARLARDLELTLDGRRVPLRPLERRVASRPGAGGLETLRLDVVYEAVGSGRMVEFRDRTFAGRIGWREVTLAARDGARLISSSVPAASESDELRAYPKDLLRSPLDVTAGAAVVSPGPAPGEPPRLESVPAAERASGGLEALIERGDLSLGVLFVSLLVAAFWGAVHALTPGHGKALVAAYLVGTRGTPRHAFMLGGTVTVAHTAGVFALGVVTLGLSQLVVPEALYPWLTLVSGMLVIGVGASVLRKRLRDRRRGAGHHHDHHHDHHDQALTSKGILGVGVAAGLLPCPSALVVLLSAIALHRVGLGVALIVAFSVGLAATITGIGLIAVLARRAFARLSFDGPVVGALPAASAALILAVGLVITGRALPGVF
jgi:ABC-type nickel/cobalt efflux system permease component RcnA/tetratricopeptide (TPR) repeat protein